MTHCAEIVNFEAGLFRLGNDYLSGDKIVRQRWDIHCIERNGCLKPIIGLQHKTVDTSSFDCSWGAPTPLTSLKRL